MAKDSEHDTKLNPGFTFGILEICAFQLECVGEHTGEPCVMVHF
jgi:hypothetical protein